MPDREVLDLVRKSAGALADAMSRLAADLSPAPLEADQVTTFQLAFLASEAAALAEIDRRCRDGGFTPALALATSLLIRSAHGRLVDLGHPDLLEVQLLRDAAGLANAWGAAAAEDTAEPQLLPELRLVADSFRRFAEDVVRPVAERIHREDLDIPDDIIDGLAELGAFGMSIPPEYGGFADRPDAMAMMVATEELSRVSLGAAGSLITRPEILARALLVGGTEEQRRTWLPDIASGRRMVAVAVTEPDAGSDVSALRLQAVDDDDGFRLSGTKTWCTFAGRAELLMVLARTEPDATLGHRGLSMFVVEKSRDAGHSFDHRQPGGGRLSGRAIPTIGYRGMHSYEVRFDDYRVPTSALVGGSDGRGRGFHLQMEAFSTGRLQTAARAVGVMQGALDEARTHAASRRAFGSPLFDLALPRARLGDMAAKTQMNRLFAHAVARGMEEPGAGVRAAMVKALSCRAAEEVTRDAMQLHGGYGYAEEYPVSRHFVDARVLSIFEGTEEVLALRVIARGLGAD